VIVDRYRRWPLALRLDLALSALASLAAGRGAVRMFQRDDDQVVARVGVTLRTVGLVAVVQSRHWSSSFRKQIRSCVGGDFLELGAPRIAITVSPLFRIFRIANAEREAAREDLASIGWIVGLLVASVVNASTAEMLNEAFAHRAVARLPLEVRARCLIHVGFWCAIGPPRKNTRRLIAKAVTKVFDGIDRVPREVPLLSRIKPTDFCEAMVTCFWDASYSHDRGDDDRPIARRF
jgi:hypothetical protein